MITTICQNPKGLHPRVDYQFDMRQYLFDFGEKQIPPIVILVTVMLYAVFLIGILYRILLWVL